MKIKLHNSLNKIDKGIGFWFLFDEKMLLSFHDNYLKLFYRIDDYYFFLRFNPKSKELEEFYGFGRNDKNPDPDWWKDFKWKEMWK